MINSAWLAGILVNTTSSALLFLAGYAFDRIRSYLQRRCNYLRRLLPFESVKRVNVCYGLMPARLEGRTYLSEEGNLATVCTLVEVLAQVLGRVHLQRVSHLSTVAEPEYRRAMLSASGPRFNRITEQYIGKLGSPVWFSKSSRSLIYRDSTTGKEEVYVTKRADAGLALRCYGVILSGILGTGEDRRRVLISAGTTTLSTFGTAVYLRRLSTTSGLARDLRRHGIVPGRRWGLVVEVVNELAKDTAVLESIPFNEELVHTTVVRHLKEQDFGKPYDYDYEKC